MTALPTQRPGAATTGEPADIDAQLLDIFFGAMPMGVAVFDADGRLVRSNETWRGFFVHYLGVDAGYVAPGRRMDELLPDSAEPSGPRAPPPSAA